MQLARRRREIAHRGCDAAPAEAGRACGSGRPPCPAETPLRRLDPRADCGRSLALLTEGPAGARCAGVGFSAPPPGGGMIKCPPAHSGPRPSARSPQFACVASREASRGPQRTRARRRRRRRGPGGRGIRWCAPYPPPAAAQPLCPPLRPWLLGKTRTTESHKIDVPSPWRCPFGGKRRGLGWLGRGWRRGCRSHAQDASCRTQSPPRCPCWRRCSPVCAHRNRRAGAPG